MTRAHGRVAPLVVLVASLLLVGCGGGGQASTTATNEGHGQVRVAPPVGEAHSHPQRSGPSEAEPQGGSNRHGASAAKGATGSARFRVKGGDNSIQEYGSEGSSTDLHEAITALHGYLDARAEGEWSRACAYLDAKVIESLSELGEPGKAQSCAELLASLSRGASSDALREAAIAEGGALRINGSQAFLLFRGAQGVDYFIPMSLHSGTWEVAAPAASPLG